ncbi:MAG: serine hydrolase, partial [Myxococcota bacterium]
PATTPDGLPNVLAERVVVMDVATGAELFGKNAGVVGNIASTGKIFVAMVVRRMGIELDSTTEITRTDHSYARGGARTRLDLRHSFKNIDLLRAMLIASDNRAPTALGRAVGLEPDQLIAAMNELARELGLADTEFTDPSGLRGNVSSARDMAIALDAALSDPVLAEIMGAREATVRSIHSRPLRIFYRNTNHALHAGRYPVLGGKTGYTRAAGYCLITAARIAGREVVMVFLGGRDKLTRYGDFNRVASWLAAGSAPALAGLPILTGRSAIIRASAGGEGDL